MATMKFFALLGPNNSMVSHIYFDAYVQLADNYTSKRAVFEDSATGNKLVVTGTGFEYNVSGDSIIAGSITAIALKDELGHNYLTFSDLKANAAGFNEAYGHGHPDFLVHYLLRGNDVITGSSIADTIDGHTGRNTIRAGGGEDTLLGNTAQDRLFGDGGNDSLIGAGGNDLLTGGRGSDIFWFGDLNGKDVITDFDARGGGELQDYLFLSDAAEFTVKRAGDDVLIKFDDFNSIRLLDVRFRDFDIDTDIQHPPM